MNICKQCGVELDDEMTVCPLCGTSITEEGVKTISPSVQDCEKLPVPDKEKHLLQRLLWQVTSIVLFSAIAATLIIDIAVHKMMTWSIYPVTICAIIFSYALLLAFWHARLVFQFIGGCIVSTLFLWLLSFVLTSARWTTELGMPILLALNVIVITFILIVRITNTRGLNVLALSFVAIAVLCLSVDGIISFYKSRTIILQWSAIVSACLLPVVTALLFMYYKTKRSATLQKIFHT